MKKTSFLSSLVAISLFGVSAHFHAADGTYLSDTGTGWLNAGNWVSNTIPGSSSDSANTDLATFAANPSGGLTIGINFSPGGNYYLGAIDVTSARTSTNPLRFNNSSSTNAGTLTLSGRTVAGFDNVILSNNGSSLVEVNNGSSQTMNLQLGNATNNVILTQSTANVTINSNIIGAGRNLTFTGGGSGQLTLTGNNTYSGSTTIGDATHAKTLVINGGSTATSNFNINNAASILQFTANSNFVNGSSISGSGTIEFIHTATSIEVVNNGSISGSGAIAFNIGPSSVFLNNGAISGTRNISKIGLGTLVLTTNNPSLSGQISHNVGMIRLNNNGALGTGNLLVTPSGGAGTLIGLADGNFTRTLGTGAGEFQVASAGGTTRSGFVAYGGDRTVNINNNASTIAWASISGGNNPGLVLNDSTATGTLFFANGLNFTTSGNRNFIIGNSPQAIDAVISGILTGGSVTTNAVFQGGGTVRLDSSSSNYVGNTHIIGNTTVIATTLANAGSISSIGASAVANAPERLLLDAGTLRYTGATASTDRNFTIGAGNATIQASGTGVLTMSGSPTFTVNENRTLTLGGTNTGLNTFSGTLANNGTGILTLVKNDSGTWVFSGNNSYTGTTTVSAGTLLINGDQTTATGAVSVASGATLGGSGTIGGATTISGTHSPGNSPGLQTFLSDLTYNNGSNVVWELAANTRDVANRGTSFDGINVTGDLTFGFTTLDLVFNLVGSTVNWTHTFWDQSYVGTDGWLVYNVSGTTFNSINLSIDVQDWVDGFGNSFNTFRSGNVFSLVQVGEDIFLNYTVIPEPGSAALLLFAGGAALLSLRRRRSA